MNRNYYFKELDTLRAIAVTIVILYHANLKFNDTVIFSGGFIGVDIFFVISGFLIGKILFEDIFKKKRNYFLNYIERRVRRILPNLLFVCFATFIGGWFLLSSENFLDLIHSLISSLGFFSNTHFWNISQEYNAENAFLIPLLHTWSLSLEAQFYIFFPIIFILLKKFSNKNENILILFLIILSFIYANIKEYNISHSSFYSFLSRGWEFLLGYASYLLSRKNFNLNIFTYEILSILGISSIILSSILLDKYIIFAPLFILIPLLGTVSIILFVKKTILVRKLFNIKPVIFIGLISYSLYLWHYPIFAFARITSLVNASVYFKYFIILFVISASVFSYYFVEKPFRNFEVINRKKFILLIIISSFLLLFLSVNSINNKGKNYLSSKLSIVSNTLNYENNINNKFNNLSKKCNPICIYQPKNAQNSKKVFLIGDSYKEGIKKQIIFDLVDLNYEVTDLKGDIYSDNIHYVKNNKILFETNLENKQKIKSLNKIKNQIIIYTQYLVGDLTGSHLTKKIDFYLTNNSFKKLDDNIRHNLLLNDLKKIILNILENNNYFVLIYPWPEMKNDIPEIIISDYYLKLFKFNYNNMASISFNEFKSRQKQVIDFYDSINHPKLIRIKPYEIFCKNNKENKCYSYDGYGYYYSDSYHLNNYGSSFISKIILDKIKELNF